MTTHAHHAGEFGNKTRHAVSKLVASNASKKAYVASVRVKKAKTAEKTNDLHQKAAHAHDRAAKLHHEAMMIAKELGNHESAKHHETTMDKHKSIAEAHRFVSKEKDGGKKKK